MSNSCLSNNMCISNGKQRSDQVCLTVKKQLLLTAAGVCVACVCAGGSVGGGGQLSHRQTVCFLRVLIRTNVPQNHDPFKTDLLHPDKDLVIKIALWQKVLLWLEASCWQNTATASPRSWRDVPARTLSGTTCSLTELQATTSTLSWFRDSFLWFGVNATKPGRCAMWEIRI